MCMVLAVSKLLDFIKIEVQNKNKSNFNYNICLHFVLAFVKSDKPAKFPNLQIKYVRGLDPIIKLLDKDGTVQDVRQISNKLSIENISHHVHTLTLLY